MSNLLALFTANNTHSPVPLKMSHQEKRKGNKSKNKAQASKIQSQEIIEIEWLKQFVNKKVISVIVLLLVIASIPYILPQEKLLPIAKITVSGDYQQLNLKKINQKLDAFLGKSFFSVDIKFIQEMIKQDPWIETVSVKRIWPNQLYVNLTEKKAVARWDSEHLLSQQAVIFKADSNKFENLPRINGYSGRSAELLQRYSELQQKFLTQEIIIAEMTEDNKGALRLVLNKNLKVNIGSENKDSKVKHLLAIYPRQIKPRIDKIKRIDFRYSNGFAIAWKDEFINQSGGLTSRGSKNV